MTANLRLKRGSGSKAQPQDDQALDGLACALENSTRHWLRLHIGLLAMWVFVLSAEVFPAILRLMGIWSKGEDTTDWIALLLCAVLVAQHSGPLPYGVA